MSKKNKIVHCQTFQSTNRVVEVTVKSIPKDVLQHQKPLVYQPPVARNCALKAEVAKEADKENNNIVRKPPSAPSQKKNSRVTVEVSQKTSRKPHQVLPKGSTWREALRNYSSIVDSESDDSDRASHARKKRMVNRERPDQGQAWQQENTPTFDSNHSDTPELIVNRQIRSSDGSSQDFRPRQMCGEALDENVRGQGRGRSYNHRSSSRSPHQERGYRAASHQHGHFTQEPASAGQPQNLNQSHQAQMASNAGNARLLSDDVNSSPFGESALQLLHQLKERIQSTGDAKGMDIVGAFEAYITGQGSLGGVTGVRTPQSVTGISPGGIPVFPTPAENIPPSTTALHNPPANTPPYSMPPRADIHKAENPAGAKQFRFANFQDPGSVIPPPQPLTEQNAINVQSLPSYVNGHRYTQEDALSHAECQASHEAEKQEMMADINSLKREIEKQRKMIAERESDIWQLRKLSSHLIANQERIVLRNNQLDKENKLRGQHSGLPQVSVRSQECQTENTQFEKPTRDWESSSCGSDRDFRSNQIQLETENEILRKEVRRLRDITLDLQNRLTKAFIDLDSERRSRSRLSGISSSRFSGSAPHLDMPEHLVRDTSLRERLNPSKPPSNQEESEVDSAYEEKTSSRLTSKVGSPLSERQEDPQVSLDTKNNPNALSKIAQSHSVVMNNSNLRHKMGESVGPSYGSGVPSVIRNTSFLSEQLPQNRSMVPSTEFCVSKSHSQNDRTYRGKCNSLESKREQSCDSASDSGRPGSSNINANARSNHESVSENDRSLSFTGMDIGAIRVCVKDLGPGQFEDIQLRAHPSISTISDESHCNAMTDQEGSFLHGVPSHSTSMLDSLNMDDDAERKVILSIGEIQNPTMESTRVQEKSPPAVDSTGTTDPSFVPVRATYTQMSLITNTNLSTVEELQ